MLRHNNGLHFPDEYGQDDCEVFYQMSEFYHPEAACGVRWNDPAFGIDWPGKVEVIWLC